MPRSAARPPAPAAEALATRLALTVGAAFSDERRRRQLTTRQLAARARVSAGTINALEAGHRLSLDAYARVATALGMPLEWVFDRRGQGARQRTDVVHAAMGESQARRSRALGLQVSIDHPYQHYQFAGRADVLAWTDDPPALLHIENRTRFPDLQQAAGSYNAKRQYLARVVAEQLGLRGFASETHVMAGLWSAEVLRAVRAAPASFEALCPDQPDDLQAWFYGRPPAAGRTSTFVLFDPFATGRQRVFVGLPRALDGARPRIRGYAEAAARLSARAAGLPGPWLRPSSSTRPNPRMTER